MAGKKRTIKEVMMKNQESKTIKIAFIGGGSQSWTPNIVRDIIFKEGMEKANLDIALLDLSIKRATAVEKLFAAKLKEWEVNRVKIWATTNSAEALKDADFVIIAISTGRLASMKNDLAIPEKYNIYHTVGDTCGPGGWSRALRNIPVFLDYAKQIKKYCPNAFVLNYTNPMGTLTNALTRELGMGKVVGLCHGVFSCYSLLKIIFELEDEKSIKIKFGGLNHFFWILDVKINGEDGYKLLKEKLKGRPLNELVGEMEKDSMGFGSRINVMTELFNNYNALTYAGDRHICEFFNCYITNLEMMDRFKIVRTSVEDREKGYQQREKIIEEWTTGSNSDTPPFPKTPSRETAADIIKAIAFDEGFVDVVNMVNIGQISNLPMGAVVETQGYIDKRGFTPLIVGELPEPLRVLCAPHCEVQIKTVDAAINGNKEEALMALVADPVCSHLTVSDIKKMGHELLEANNPYVPDGYLV